MTINVTFNGVFLTCEYNLDAMMPKRAYHKGDDILPLIEGSTGLTGELTRLIREAHKKEYGE